MKKDKFQPKYLVDKGGKTIAVQLDIKSYKALLEEAEDRIDVRRAEKIMAKKGKTHTLAELEKSLLKKKK
jgi:hypothetical protein